MFSTFSFFFIIYLFIVNRTFLGCVLRRYTLFDQGVAEYDLFGGLTILRVAPWLLQLHNVSA